MICQFIKHTQTHKNTHNTGMAHTPQRDRKKIITVSHPAEILLGFYACKNWNKATDCALL